MGRKDFSEKSGRHVINRREFLASTGIAVASALSGVSISFAQEKRPVKVGFILPEQGPYAMESRSLLAGFQLFLKEKKPDGPQVEIVKKDPGPNDERALEALAELIAPKDVLFIVAPPSLKGSEQIIHGTAGANRIVFITNPSVRLVSGEMCLPAGFRIRSNTYQCGYSLSAWALKNAGRKAFLCGDDVPEANEVADFFAYGFERSGGTFANRIMIPPDSQDFGKLLEAMNASDATLVFAAFSGEKAAGFMKALSNAAPAIKQSLIGPEYLSSFPETVDLMKGTSLSVRTVTSVIEPQEFTRVLKEKTGIETDDASRAAEGYDLAQVILGAASGIQNEDTDVDSLSKSIAEMTISGPRGKFTFDKNHEPVLEMLVQEWQFSGQAPNRKVIETLGSVKTPDLGCGRIGFQTKPESEIKDEDPVWEDKDQ
ncbi:MAG: ABC transporter substrate-binding protein [Desulfomonile tiedjei]|uniref:ABC transporter substrate-binding protein n=1 Tax=Desulfomonile tiedjei TaxID=2358 RepID=A0A9D6V2A8_9BACT|nr:ABC transporter substrate-binding protein [Desulfomonile tiedjei]